MPGPKSAVIAGVLTIIGHISVYLPNGYFIIMGSHPFSWLRNVMSMCCCWWWYGCQTVTDEYSIWLWCSRLAAW